MEKEQRMKPGIPTADASLETSADYIPDLTKDRKVHFMLEDPEEENTASAVYEVASEHDAECDDDQQESSSEGESSDSDIGDTSDASDVSEDSTTIQGENSEHRESPGPSPTSGLNIDQLFQQFIEVGQLYPSSKLSSLDQLTR